MTILAGRYRDIDVAANSRLVNYSELIHLEDLDIVHYFFALSGLDENYNATYWRLIALLSKSGFICSCGMNTLSLENILAKSLRPWQ